MIAARMANLEAGQTNLPRTSDRGAITQEKAGKALNVGVPSVGRAKAVIRSSRPAAHIPRHDTNILRLHRLAADGPALTAPELEIGYLPIAASVAHHRGEVDLLPAAATPAPDAQAVLMAVQVGDGA